MNRTVCRIHAELGVQLWTSAKICLPSYRVNGRSASDSFVKK